MRTVVLCAFRILPPTERTSNYSFSWAAVLNSACLIHKLNLIFLNMAIIAGHGPLCSTDHGFQGQSTPDCRIIWSAFKPPF